MAFLRDFLRSLFLPLPIGMRLGLYQRAAQPGRLAAPSLPGGRAHVRA